MADRTKIAWTDHTFNPWIGCQKVSPGCDICYAETLTNRYGWTQWGPEGERVRTKPANWRKPLGWNRQAGQEGRRHRVFSASLADIFDNQAPEGAREDLWELIRSTPNLDWQLLTKRPQNILEMLPPGWPEGFEHVWLGVTAEDQTEYDRRWPILAAITARVHFISYEPALGPLTLRGHDEKPGWLIWGGESGTGCRTMEPGWARAIVAETRELKVAVFGKQWGSYASNPLVIEQCFTESRARELDPPGNGKGGALLDGMMLREFPEVMGIPTLLH